MQIGRRAEIRIHNLWNTKQGSHLFDYETCVCITKTIWAWRLIKLTELLPWFSSVTVG
jgi:hypothetical protein